MADAKPITSRKAPSLRRVAIFRSMPLPDLTPEEYDEIARLVRSVIDGERYVLSPRIKRLKSHPGKARSGSREADRDTVPATAAERAAEPAVCQAEGQPPAAL